MSDTVFRYRTEFPDTKSTKTSEPVVESLEYMELEPPRSHWDVFNVKPKSDTDLWAEKCDNFFTTLKKAFKILAHGVCFLIVLVAGKSNLGNRL